MPFIFIDTETYRFSRGYMAPKIVSLAWKSKDAQELLTGNDAKEWLEAALLTKTIKLFAHNAAYDFSCALATWPELGPLIFEAYAQDRVGCTQIRESLLDIADGHYRFYPDKQGNWAKKAYSLAGCVSYYFGRDIDKSEDTWRVRYEKLDGIPIEEWPKEAIDYAIGDVEEGWEVLAEQSSRAKAMGYNMPTQYLEARAGLALYLTKARGIRTDGHRLQKITEEVEGKINGMIESMYEHGLLKTKRKRDLKQIQEGEPCQNFDLSKDTKKIKALIAESYQGEELPKTEKGNIKMDAETIEKCNHPHLAPLIEYNGLTKVKGTYLDNMVAGVDGPIHANFKVLGAESSRTSCEKPNLQNQPRMPGVRECYKARDGFVFIACDFDSQEMRTLAQNCLDLLGDSALAERYQLNPDYDPHTELAAQLIGIDPKEALELKAQGDKEIKDARQHAKIANFGLPGGMGVTGFVTYAKGYGVDFSPDEAARIIAAYKTQWREMPQYFDHVSRTVGSANCGDLVIPQSGFIRGGCGYTDGCNTYFQTLAAHASKSALWEVCKRCYVDRESWLYGARPVNFVHDEVIIECREEWAHEAALEMETVMSAAMQVFTPDIPARASAALMRNWSKAAEPVKVDGRLVPWDDLSNGST